MYLGICIDCTIQHPGNPLNDTINREAGPLYLFIPAPLRAGRDDLFIPRRMVAIQRTSLRGRLRRGLLDVGLARRDQELPTSSSPDIPAESCKGHWNLRGMDCEKGSCGCDGCLDDLNGRLHRQISWKILRLDCAALRCKPRNLFLISF